KIGELDRLNVSARNCRLNASVSLKFLKIDAFCWKYPGPRRIFTPALPIVPVVCALKAVMSNHSARVGLARFPEAIRLGRSFTPVTPVLATAELFWTLNTRPDDATRIAFICQPPNACLTKPLADFAKGSS